jgi:hypothetical protein
MSQAIQNPQKEEKKKEKKSSKFDNILIDSLYNIIAYVPTAIITWLISNIDF